MARAAAARKPPRRSLWGHDRGGRFRTHGRDSVATVRGTTWQVTDRCDGTVTRVTEGAVLVRDTAPAAARSCAPGRRTSRRTTEPVLRRATMAALRRLRGSHRVTILAAGLVAVAVALAAEATHVVEAQEQDTIGLRFQLRGEQPATGVAVLAIDDETMAALRPLAVPALAPRARGRRAARRGRGGIVYDVQFSEPTRARDDLALYDALGRAGGAILAATATDEPRRHADPRRPREPAGDRRGGRLGRLRHRRPRPLPALPLRRRPGCRRSPWRPPGAAGRPLRQSDFEAGGAWIDYRGAPGTIPSLPFSALLESPRRARSVFRDRIVVVGVTAPTAQDVHATPAAVDRLMSGPEIQANAMWTALHGLPLRSAPRGRRGSPSCSSAWRPPWRR